MLGDLQIKAVKRRGRASAFLVDISLFIRYNLPNGRQKSPRDRKDSLYVNGYRQKIN